VDDKVFEQARKFYTMDSIQRKDGGFIYRLHDQGSISDAKNCVGRTLASLFSMELLGLLQTEAHKKAKEFAKNNFKDLDRSKHGPSFHMLMGAISSFYGQDKDLWTEYNKQYRETILKAQKEDGSILINPRQGAVWPMDGSSVGPVHTTAAYAIVLQLHHKKLLFDRLKPVKLSDEQRPQDK
jgi:hypothetical protein